MDLDKATYALSNLQIKKTNYIHHTCTNGAIPSSKIAKCMANTTYIHNSPNHKKFLDSTALDIPTGDFLKFWISI